MLCDCIVTMLKNTFDSLVCEFTAKAGEGGIFSRCRCNIFAIGNRFVPFFSYLKPVCAEYADSVEHKQHDRHLPFWMRIGIPRVC